MKEKKKDLSVFEDYWKNREFLDQYPQEFLFGKTIVGFCLSRKINVNKLVLEYLFTRRGWKLLQKDKTLPDVMYYKTRKKVQIVLTKILQAERKYKEKEKKEKNQKKNKNEKENKSKNDKYKSKSN